MQLNISNREKYMKTRLRGESITPIKLIKKIYSDTFNEDTKFSIFKEIAPKINENADHALNDILDIETDVCVFEECLQDITFGLKVGEHEGIVPAISIGDCSYSTAQHEHITYTELVESHDCELTIGDGDIRVFLDDGTITWEVTEIGMKNMDYDPLDPCNDDPMSLYIDYSGVDIREAISVSSEAGYKNLIFLLIDTILKVYHGSMGVNIEDNEDTIDYIAMAISTNILFNRIFFPHSDVELISKIVGIKSNSPILEMEDEDDIMLALILYAVFNNMKTAKTIIK